MTENTNNTSEEIELGKLFQLIGNGFKNMFNAIGDFFAIILHFIILALIFLKKHFIKIAIASVLGAGIGYFLEKEQEPEYQSDTIIETNFGSGFELYNQVNKLNSLIDREEFKELATIFDIPESEAARISSFSIEAFEKENNLIKEFDYYKQHTDTIYTRDLTPKIYAKRLQDQDYRLQKITAFSKEQTVFTKLNKGVVKLIENEHFNKLLSLKNSELNNKKELLKKDLIVIDSLRKVYKKVAILTAKSSNPTGTNINFSEKTKKSNPDIDLFYQTRSILNQLKETNEEIIHSSFIANTVTNFEIGYIEKSILTKKWIKYGVLAGLLMIFGILAIQFNKYLDNYNKEK